MHFSEYTRLNAISWHRQLAIETSDTDIQTNSGNGDTENISTATITNSG